jgi:surfeit locus 1 family protein
LRRIVLFLSTLVVGAAAIGLGLWQLRRYADRSARNRIALEERALPPLRADSIGAPGLPPYRRAIVKGTLDEPGELLLRNRLVAGVPAVLVVTPLRRPGTDTALLVNRGYVPAADAVDPGDATWSEAGREEFRGVLLPLPDRGDGKPIVRNGRESWLALDKTALRARFPYPIAAVYLVAEPDSGTDRHTTRGTVYPMRAEPPPLDRGPHLSYALQWFGIAAAVVGFGVFFVLRSPGRRLVEGGEVRRPEDG